MINLILMCIVYIETITLEQMIWDVQKWFIVTVVSVIDLHV